MWINRRPLTERMRGQHSLALVIGVLALLPYLNSLGGSFTFDDIGLIDENPAITGAHASLWQQFTTVFQPGGLYRPLTMATYLANHRLDIGVAGYHAVNLCLHVAVTVAAFYVARALLDSALGAMATAALFAVHPIHTEAVSSIVGRAELLAAFLVLVSLLLLIRAVSQEGRRRGMWLASSIVVLAAGLLAKESAFMAIPLCGIVYWWVAPRPTIRSLSRVMVPYVLLGAAYLGLRLIVIGALTLPVQPELLDNPLAHVPLLPRLGTALVVLAQYLSQLTFPVQLSADYSFNEIPVVASAFDLRFVAAAVLFVTLGMALMLSFRRSPVVVLAAFLTFVPLLLTANILFPIGTIKAERLLYLPSFGWCLAGGWLLVQTPSYRRRGVMALMVVVLVAYAARTWVRNRDWRNNLTLFTATVESSPRSAKGHHNLAVALVRRDDLDAALVQFRDALAIYPPYEEAAFGVGKIYDEKGLDGRALAWYQKATEIDSSMASAHLNAGALQYKHGDFVSAEASFRAGLESQPDNPRLLIGLGMVRLVRGDRLQAQTLVNRASALADGDPVVTRGLAQARQALTQGVKQ